MSVLAAVGVTGGLMCFIGFLWVRFSHTEVYAYECA